MINDLPEEDRPREKLARWGAAALSLPELIAIFLRVGVRGSSAIQVAQSLISKHGSLQNLAKLTTTEIANEHGIGPAKAAQLAAAFEIGIRLAKEKVTSTPLNSPELIYEFMQPQVAPLTTESLFVILTDTRLNHLRTIEVSRGSVDQTICHPRDILHHAVLHQSYGFILIHNHPSGDPTPSTADKKMTANIAEAAALLQVRFVDHIIIGTQADYRNPYYSFREQGQI